MTDPLPSAGLAPPPPPSLWKGRPLVRFHVMAKPVGPMCNLRCEYCFYLHKRELLSMPGACRMSDEVLESFIRQYIVQQNSPEVIFSWQGGEPVLAGLEFFEKVVALQKHYAHPGLRIENDLQTNGTLLDDDWCRFLAKHHFLVGLSVDGPRKLHDQRRKYADGHGSFDEVWKAAQRLRRHGVPFNTLTCIHSGNAGRPLDVYRFLTRELGSTRLQFIPIVEPRAFCSIAPHQWDRTQCPRTGGAQAQPEPLNGFVHDWSVSPEQWGFFLCKVFDDWHRRDVGKVGVYLFDSALRQLRGDVASLCSLAPICGKALAIEHNGDVYACDHYVYPEYRLGNILQTPLVDLCLSPRQERFGYAKDLSLPPTCRACRHLWLCAGGCPKDRFVLEGESGAAISYLCEGWKRYFDHLAGHDVSRLFPS